jgi:hypothetical protein
MEFEIHKQEQQMLVYWEQSAGPDFKPKILIWRWKMKTMKYTNHKYVIMKIKNR